VRTTTGGVRAQSKRGAFAQRWWSRRWIEVLESLGLGARLRRGRTYARNGNVAAIEIDERGVRATVCGSREEPYAVTIAMQPLSSEQWRHVSDKIARTPRFVASLLSGTMPQDIEEAFTAVHCALFPRTPMDLRTSCTCPDWSNPCKHVAAVYYLLAEEFDRDPFLLFTLRGLDREGVVAALSARELGLAATVPPDEPEVLEGRPPIEAPAVDGWPLRRAGRFPFWNGTEPLETALDDAYALAGQRAAAMLAETWPDG
jgi:uncharacterized Zn finger protein